MKSKQLSSFDPNLRLKGLRGALCLSLMLSLPAALIFNFAPQTSSSAVVAKAKPKYNVLFLIADDLRPELGCYGNKLIKTPNIDGLAARGTRFNNAFAQFPLCNPSRSSLLTGHYPTQTGVMDNNTYFRVAHPDYVSLPQHFKANGYATLRVGKIFHGGIDDPVSWTKGGEAPDPAITGRAPSRIATGAAPDTSDADAGPSEATPAGTRTSPSDRIIVLPGNGESHGDYKTATRAIEYLEAYKDQPFFLAVGFVKPHSPPTAPKKFFDLYDAKKIPLPPDFATRPAAPPGFPQISIPRKNADLFIGREASPEAAREMIQAYWASTSFVDEQVGRVIAALDRLGLRDNTIIVFWGDHGYHLGEKGKWSKAYSLFEVGLRAPLIVAMPRAKAQVSEGPVQLLDMYPTLAELCALPRPNGNEGHSFVALLNNPRAKWSHPAYSVTMFQGKLGKSVRTDRWHYVEWDEGKAGAMLFDHSKDPLELKNLADDAAFEKTVREMKELLRQMP